MNIIQQYHAEHRQAYAEILEQRSRYLATVPEYQNAKKYATADLYEKDCFAYLAIRENMAGIENEIDDKLDRLRALMLLSVTADSLLTEFRSFLDLNSADLPNLQYQYNAYTLSYGHADERLYKRLVHTALQIRFDKTRILNLQQL
ncbi:hypothetical protein [Chitinophaga rhizophila]|uniref:Uncharacterized protein n=1 Tax=Chitinophaga rhizophila TaxID=2866212 RepID=A0ABS7G776_9BACT|nr:hypothetical protein [Chitinophaga rhizophila]MBW8683501.1 hypothetical protein [Chitinophaga rhizophila]